MTITVAFSEAMNPATINASSFTLAGISGVPITGIVTYDASGSVAKFSPAAPLAYSTNYRATVTTGATNLAGNGLAANYVWTFTTGSAPVTTPPAVVSTSPVNGATRLPNNQPVSAIFSKAMDPLTITTASFRLTDPGGSLIVGTVAYGPTNFIATFMPAAPMEYSATYTATVTTGATDLAGNALAANYAWTFTYWRGSGHHPTDGGFDPPSRCGHRCAHQSGHKRNLQ